MEMKSCLAKIAEEMGISSDSLIFPDCDIVPENIKIIMIDESPHKKPEHCFYSTNPKSSFVRTTLGLFGLAGSDVKSIQDLLDMGIYVTTAIKIPRDKSKPVKADEIKTHVPVLEREIALFPNLKIIMLMGNTAIKAMNYSVKARTGDNFLSTGHVAEIRNNVYEWEGKRVLPSYMMSNRTILSDEWAHIRPYLVEDIRRMLALIQE